MMSALTKQAHLGVRMLGELPEYSAVDVTYVGE